jgi:hypothetical protein
MGYVHIKEPVEVIVQFSPQGLIRPLAFRWAGRQYRVDRTTYRWRTGKGRETLRFFAVVTRADTPVPARPAPAYAGLAAYPSLRRSTPASAPVPSEDAYQLCFRDADATWWLEKVWTAA